MSKRGAAANNSKIQLGGAKDKETDEIKSMLDMDRDLLGPGKLGVIDISKWKNQPVSLTQAIKILKEQQLV